MSFIDDVRYAARSLIKRPALLAITTIALSIGIAANAIMFGVVDQLLLRPPAYVQAPSRAIGAGLLIGGLVAIVASRWIVDLLYETSPHDPLVYGIAAAVLALAALIASVVPAHRSATVDPAQAMRTE